MRDQRHWVAEMIESSRVSMKMLQEKYIPSTSNQRAVAGYHIIQQRSLKHDSRRAEGCLTLIHRTLGALTITFNEGHYESCKRLCSRFYPAQVLKGDSKASVVSRALMKILSVPETDLPIEFTYDLGEPYLLIDVPVLASRVLCPTSKRKICDEEFLVQQPLIAKALDVNLLFSQFKRAIEEDLSGFALNSFEKVLCVCALLNRTIDQLSFTDAEKKRHPRSKSKKKLAAKKPSKLGQMLAKLHVR